MASCLSMDMILKAGGLLKGVAHKTPLDFSATFSRLTGSRVYLKMENLQKTGSFKIRGAYNKICFLDEAIRQKGVIAASAGNHAQGVAYAAKSAGIKSLIVMPVNAPIAKVVATQGYGADVVLAGSNYDEAFARALVLREQTGAAFIHSFDDPEVIAGQGTIALELFSDLPDLDAILVPVGGGGLLAGIALAARALKPEVKIIGVQSEGAPAVCRLFRKKEIISLSPAWTIADGINVCRPGKLTVELIKRYADDLVLVNEEEISESILLLLERSKIVAEGAGAVGLAALLHKKVSLPSKKAVVVISGGNVDANIISLIIERGLIKSGRRLIISLLLPDQPGSLSRLLALLAGARVNLISINHDRVKLEVPLREAEVRLVLETRNRDHQNMVLDILAKNGYRVNGFLASGGAFTPSEV